jgi:hypothetical protein
MEVGQGPNWDCSAKVKKKILGRLYTGSIPIVQVALSKGPNRASVSPHPRTETDPVSETSCFLVIRILNYRQSPKIQ